MSYFKTHCAPLLFRNINNVTMPSEISKIKLFDEKEQSAEKFPDTESNFQTLLSSAKANNINTNLLQDDHKPLEKLGVGYISRHGYVIKVTEK